MNQPYKAPLDNILLQGHVCVSALEVIANGAEFSPLGVPWALWALWIEYGDGTREQWPVQVITAEPTLQNFNLINFSASVSPSWSLGIKRIWIQTGFVGCVEFDVRWTEGKATASESNQGKL